MNLSYDPPDFNDWAESYDRSVKDCQDYPFTGYQAVLDRLAAIACPSPGQRVLDLGCGTGNLSLPFARAGCELTGTDFSPAMLAIARRKVPAARFLEHDLRTPLPDELHGPFERILSAYVFHHFPLELKLHLLEQLASRLSPGGLILIGDIAFPDKAALELAKAAAAEAWEEEYYWLADETLAALPPHGLNGRFEVLSSCAGVFVFSPLD